MYCDFPNCVGCGADGALLCCQGAGCCSKGRMGYPYAVGMVKADSNGVQPNGDDSVICGLGLYCCHTLFKKPATFCGGETHCCCFYSHGACGSFWKGFSPCKSEIAKVCAVCGFAVFPVVGCCKSLGEVNTAAGSPAPVDLEMVR